MLKETLFAGQNLWLVKPSDCNRGRGVQVFNNLEEIRKVLNDYAEVAFSPEPLDKIKSDSFIIQKYIERPLLINERKFDTRLWVLVT